MYITCMHATHAVAIHTIHTSCREKYIYIHIDGGTAAQLEAWHYVGFYTQQVQLGLDSYIHLVRHSHESRSTLEVLNNRGANNSS